MYVFDLQSFTTAKERLWINGYVSVLYRFNVTPQLCSKTVISFDDSLTADQSLEFTFCDFFKDVKKLYVFGSANKKYCKGATGNLFQCFSPR